MTDCSLAPDSWWDGLPFHRILLDAPCSGTGIIRRRPDVKWHRRSSDIGKLAEAQLSMASALWPLLAPQGLLLYATCSILPQENAAVVERFLKGHEDALVRPIPGRWGQDQSVGRQILPGEEEMDGFYYALLAKR